MTKTIFALSSLIFLLLHNLSLALDISSFPDMVKLVGKDKKVSFESLCRTWPILLLVGSHSSFILVNQLPKSWSKREMPIKGEQFIGVAAIGEAPLFVKKMIINGNLEELISTRNKELKDIIPGISNSPIIIDTDNKVVNSLGITGLGKTGFEAFVILKDGKVEKIYSGKIKSEKDDYNQALQEMKVEEEADAILDSAERYFKE